MESIFTLLPAYLGIILLISLPRLPNNTLLEYGIWAGILFSPLLATAMYRESKLYQFERLGILTLVLFYTLLIVSVLNENT